MPASALAEWMEYETLEPFGAWRDNWHSAMTSMILANANRGPHTKEFRLADFFYVDPQSAQEKRDLEMLEALRRVSVRKK